MTGRGTVRGVSARLSWDEAVAVPEGVAPGDLAQGDAIVLSPGPGRVDAARLGSGFTGSGILAEVRFRAVGSGNPSVRLASLVGRDAANRNVSLAGVLGATDPGPGRTQLGIVAPNPFRTQLAIQLTIGHEQRVRLVVYDMGGRVVRRLIDGAESPGSRLVAWDGRDDHGRVAPVGVYLLRLEADEVRQSRRVQLLR